MVTINRNGLGELIVSYGASPYPQRQYRIGDVTAKLAVKPGEIPGRNQADFLNGSGLALFVSSITLNQLTQEPAYQLVNSAISQSWNGTAPNFIVWPDEIVFAKDGKLPAGGNLLYNKAFRIIESLGVPTYFGFYFFPFDSFDNPVYFTDADSLIQQRNILSQIQSNYNRSAAAVPSGTTVAEVLENDVVPTPRVPPANRNTILWLLGGAAAVLILLNRPKKKTQRVSGIRRKKKVGNVGGVAESAAIQASDQVEVTGVDCKIETVAGITIRKCVEVETDELVGAQAPKEVVSESVEAGQVSGVPKKRKSKIINRKRQTRFLQ